MKPRDISGGSLREAELPGVRDVAWPARVERSESPLAQGLRRFRRSATALVGVAIVVALILVALFADVLAPQSPIASDQTHTFERPSWDYPLGTDQLGRDMLSRIIHGSRISLAVGVSSVLLALFVGVPFGLIAGYYGGRLDTVIMRSMDLILAFPIYLLAIILMVIFAPTAGLIGTIKVTGAIAIVRADVFSLVIMAGIPLTFATMMVAFGSGIENRILYHMGHEFSPYIALLWGAIRWLIATLTSIAVIALIYHNAVPRTQPWHSVLPGATLATAMWFIATTLFSMYLHGYADYSIIYGSLGVGIALLVWMYMISLIVLIGAEFNAMLFPRAFLGKELLESSAANVGAR